MKLKIKKLISITIVSMSVVISGIITVNATNQDDPPSASEVFNKEKVKELVEIANDMLIEMDKGINTRASYGSYPTRKGVILVTPDPYKGVNIGHAGIIYIPSQVVEANATGVEIGNNNWDKSKDQAYGVTVTSVTNAQDIDAANWCYNRRGLPYNPNFYRMDYRDKFYCSHLIRSAYLDLYGIDLNTGDFDVAGAKAIHPMELVNGPKTSLVYRKK
ncbi:hypothetical protein [Thomasclavelia cocleata]|uniref:hypothetical protein n=1 Tax=Thomasclavelia cocleata TaxID=69824 RepID=UPI00248B6CB5|nr:hypothetical protein [Thomasclavelia cocleata]